MTKLSSLLERSRAGDLDAFGQVVRRFQDMAHGYAYSVLGDFHLAEDAAQEAFIEAYCKLANLRELAAFPGWLRRIVFKYCDRIRRKRRMATAPLEEGMRVSDSDTSRSELQEQVLSAIQTLPEGQREATTLYYINGYSQNEIATFLEVPLTTIRKRLQYSRKRLKERVIGMIEETLKRNAPSPQFRKQIIDRLQHWERFQGGAEEKIAMVSSDAYWRSLLRLEVELTPVSEEARAIRRQIASLEACHESYLSNVVALLRMIGAMRPRKIMDCGAASAARLEELRAYCKALESWLGEERLPCNSYQEAQEVFQSLGKRTERKMKLVEHLIRKLQDNSYAPYAPEDEDFNTTESRIHHLEICNHNWRKNFRILLKEICEDKRLFEWHTADGYSACGDCPNRVANLRDTMAMAAAWVDDRIQAADKLGPVLGALTPEKRWLVASLCKHVAAQHAQCDPTNILAMPTLCS